MKQERSFLQQGTLFLKGLIMGAANKVPGVSGGTVSFVFGFYEELIFSFKKLISMPLNYFLKEILKVFTTM